MNRRSSAVGRLRFVALCSSLVMLAACAPLTSEGSLIPEDSQTALHDEVSVAVAAAVPEAIDVDVTTFRSGLGVNLSVTVILESPEPVSVDLVDRALRAAWSVDEGQSNSVELDVRDADDGAIALGDVVEELGVGGGVGSRVTVSRQDLADRYGP